MTYEKLLKQADPVKVFEKNMPMSIKGLYSEGVAWINNGLLSNAEKGCVLAEELGHYHTSTGDILDQKQLHNRKQEKKARIWAYEKLVPLSSIIVAHKTGIRNRNELADHLDVIEEFLDSAIRHYLEKHGIYVTVEGYTICFEPLGVLQMFE